MNKFFKVLLWLAGILVILVLLIIAAFKLFFPIEKAKAYAIEEAEEYLGRKVTIETIDISIWRGLGLQLVEVTVANPDEFTNDDIFLTANNVDVKMGLWPLLSGEFRVDRFIINGPHIKMIKQADGSINYSFKSSDSLQRDQSSQRILPEGAPAVAAVSFEHFEIDDGDLTYIDDSSGTRLHLSGLSFVSALKNPHDNLYRSLGNLEIDSVSYVADETWPPYNLDLNYTAELDLDKMRLSLEESHFIVNDIALQVKGELLDLGKAWNGRVNVKTENASANDFLGLLSTDKRKLVSGYSIDGRISVNVDVEYNRTNREPLYYAGTVALDNVSLKNGIIDGTFKFDKALIDFKPDNARANIEGGTFNGQPFKGHVVVNNFDDPFLNGDITGSFDLSALKPLIAQKGNYDITGKAEIDLNFSGKIKDKKNLQYSGNFAVTNGSFSSELLPEPIESLDLDFYIDNEVTTVRKIVAKTKSANLTFSGRFQNVLNYYLADTKARSKMPAPSIVGKVNGQTDLQILNGYLSKARAGQITGDTRFNLTVSGNPLNLADLKPHGRMTITDGTFSDTLLAEPVKRFDANITVVADTFKVDSMKVQFVSSDVALTGKIIRPVPYFLAYLGIIEGSPAKPLFELTVTSRRFDVDKMFPEAVPGSEAVTAELPADTVPTLILPDMNGTGTFSVDTLVYSQIEFSNIKGLFRVQDRKLECYNVTGNVYSGSVTGETSIDLNDFARPQYIGEFKATGIEANDFMSRFTKFGGSLSGKLDVNGNYNAVGWNRDAFLNSLTMDGLAQMNKGKLSTSGVTYKTLNALASSFAIPFEKEQPLRNLASRIVVENGQVRLDNLKSSLGTLGDLELAGFYSFGGSLNYKGSVLLSKENTQKVLSNLSRKGVLGGLAGLFTDKSVDRIKLPLSIKGTIDDPKVKIDMGALTEKAGKNILNELGNFLQKKLVKDTTK